MKPQKSHDVITRFAPSPTGFLHIGAARTALFNFAFAKKNNGKMILRIEDTDRLRSKGEYEKDILEGLRWLDLNYDDLYRQSERGALYKKYITDLLQKDAAYLSHDEEGGSPHAVIRFRNPGKDVSFEDIIRGTITFNTRELGDFVIARDEESPLYHFAVVVDDFEMGVTHVIRGEDHISNTPRQILLQEAIRAPRPLYAHLPLVLAPDRTKLSKRHGATSLREYRDGGYLPEAIINFLALLGWSPSGNEVFSLQEFTRDFVLEKIQKSGAIFNIEKLQWLNREHIKKLPARAFEEYVKRFLPRELRIDEEKLAKLLPLIAERIDVFGDVGRMFGAVPNTFPAIVPTKSERARRDGVKGVGAGEFDYFFTRPDPEPHQVMWKNTPVEKTKHHLDSIIEMLSKIAPNEFNTTVIKNTLWNFATQEGRGEVLWPMRFALSGRGKSPDPFTIASILGKDETLERLKIASKKLADI